MTNQLFLLLQVQLPLLEDQFGDALEKIIHAYVLLCAGRGEEATHLVGIVSGRLEIDRRTIIFIYLVPDDCKGYVVLASLGSQIAHPRVFQRFERARVRYVKHAYRGFSVAVVEWREALEFLLPSRVPDLELNAHRKARHLDFL